MADRVILHLDLDAFYCAVEEQRDPRLRGRPVAVGGRPESRGVVASCSYAARRFGIRSAMPMSRALRLCSHLRVVPPDHEAYRRASRRVMDLLHEFTPLVEQLSIDEAFLDLSDTALPGEVAARRIQRRINGEPALPCSIGVASNKLVAKIANNVGKASVRTGRPPNSIKVVPQGREALFLAPLPVKELWGVGPGTADKLARLGVRTIGQLARYPEGGLIRRFGKNGRDLVLRARGLDDRPVVTEHETKSVSQETTFSRDAGDREALRGTLRALCRKVGERLRKKSLKGATVKIKLRWPDFTTFTRQSTLREPTDSEDVVFQAALELLEKSWKDGQRVRLLGVGVSHFDALPARQLHFRDVVQGRDDEREKGFPWRDE